MDKFDGYGGLFLQEIDPELEAALKQCKTEDERKEVMQEYFQTKVIAAIITIGGWDDYNHLYWSNIVFLQVSN